MTLSGYQFIGTPTTVCQSPNINIYYNDWNKQNSVTNYSDLVAQKNTYNVLVVRAIDKKYRQCL